MAKSSNSYYILRNAKMPAVIVECGFMSNPGEERLLNDPNYQYKIAWAIYKGIIAYFQKTSE
ncbi:MAG: N-acetylmuramoyl-L-alanine amidase, partial [Caldanaerobacter subterraneus]